MEPKQEIAMPLLTDDLEVDILSRLPLKSFCRFKCVCKSWLAFSSDPHYRQKLPRTPIGLLYQNFEYGRAVHLAELSSSDMEIDTTLSFLPDYEYLKLMDCNNGLFLCCYVDFTSYFPDMSRSIVCNPATQEWIALPHSQHGSDESYYGLVLCFDPLWSQHFYVLKLNGHSWHPEVHQTSDIEIFSSQDFTRHSSLLESETGFYGRSHFIHGVLYVQHSWDHCVLAMEVDATDTHTQLLKQRTIQLPGFPVRPEMFRCSDGCIAQSSGVLCYAQQEIDGCTMRIWNLEGSSPERWVVKHRLNMIDAFGRDILFSTDCEGFWCFDYDIFAFDLEREVVILTDRITRRFLSFSISTGKLSEIQNAICTFPSISFYYVPYYCKFPASVRRGTLE